jgi:predicted MFS family arabinose efflux permease
VSDRAAWRLVAALAALNVLAYVDRQLVASLAPLLIADLRLTRAQVGLLVGPAFILLFAVGTLVLGAAADRSSRPRLIALGLLLWSAATCMTGTASSVAALVAWRALTGIGEATLPPTAIAMLGDRFPPRRLGLATGIYYAGIPVGFALSLAASGLIAPRFGWRACFAAVGAIGLAAVALVWRLQDPPRRGAAAAAPAGRSLGPVLRRALGDRRLVLVIAGATLLAYTSASSQHLVTWLVQDRGFAYARATFLAALLVFAAGLAGNLGIGAWSDRVRGDGPCGRLPALVGLGAVATAASITFYLAPAGSPLFFACWGIAQAWTLGWYAPLIATVHELAPRDAGGSVVGLCLMALNLVGVGLGPWITGVIGDRASLTLGLVSSVGVGTLGLCLLLVATRLAPPQGTAPSR